MVCSAGAGGEAGAGLEIKGERGCGDGETCCCCRTGPSAMGVDFNGLGGGDATGEYAFGVEAMRD